LNDAGRYGRRAASYQQASYHQERVTSSDIAIIGAGRVGASLGRTLRERGAPIRAVASRNPEHARQAAAFIGGVAAIDLNVAPRLAGRLIIAVSDAAIESVAAQLAGAGFAGGMALHTAGSRGPEALRALRKAGAATGVLHPFQTFSSPERGCEVLPGSYFAIAGDERAVEWARELAAALGGRTLAIAQDQWGLYHAAAVMASNYQVTLMDAAVEMLQCAGVASDDALSAIGTIARATLENITRQGPRDALTGPIARGDVETVARNLSALTDVRVETRDLYRAAGRRTIPMAEQRGLDRRRAEALRNIL
jgi:predicted short-subunit dehydrogenase-like oxidoreductase (DUF2520 family)